MAAAKHFRVKKGTVSWTPSGGQAVVIDGVQSISFGEGGRTTNLMSDASELVQEKPLSEIEGNIEITTLNQLQAGPALALGAGALVFELEQVKTGRGAVAGTGKIITFSNCTLVSKRGGAGSAAGESATLSIEAAAFDNSGTDVIYIIADVV